MLFGSIVVPMGLKQVKQRVREMGVTLDKPLEADVEHIPD
jgi:hypothetical protein